jgi:hypothetical protein
LTEVKIDTPVDGRKQNSKLIDRRSGEDRRRVYNLDYFENGGRERRKQDERRHEGERRADCVRVSEWSSVCFDIDDDV